MFPARFEQQKSTIHCGVLSFNRGPTGSRTHYDGKSAANTMVGATNTLAPRPKDRSAPSSRHRVWRASSGTVPKSVLGSGLRIRRGTHRTRSALPLSPGRSKVNVYYWWAPTRNVGPRAVAHARYGNGQGPWLQPLDEATTARPASISPPATSRGTRGFLVSSFVVSMRGRIGERSVELSTLKVGEQPWGNLKRLRAPLIIQ